MLSLAEVPLPKIGSLTIDDDGQVDLSNRPLTMAVQHSEHNHGLRTATAKCPSDLRAKVDTRGESLHVTVDSYVRALLALHEARLEHQPNAVSSPGDARYQATAVVIMRSIWNQFISSRSGPFFLSLTDLNRSNIFVDDAWHITAIIDLEWSCSWPVEMIHPPRWLLDESPDNDGSTKSNMLHAEFVQIFREVELQLSSRKDPDRLLLYPFLEQGLSKGTLWCTLALTRPDSLCQMVYEKILPGYIKADDVSPEFFMTALYRPDAAVWIQRKVQDKQEYDAQLLQAFHFKE
ncbi:hypothetical protein ANO11243_031450 [Dothideomycetidae sp. 11243]|nr:hypothetical protein ANO11243_031450 [fungal sp. No.11243]